jgi:NAD(P)H-hydrate epimerase
MKTITAAQSKRFDRNAIDVYGFPLVILMENAGRGVAEEIIKLKKRKIAIICGKGNNGGDGFVCARHLIAKGIKPDIFLAGAGREVRGEAKFNKDILLKLKQRIYEIDEKNICIFKEKMSGYNLIVDAIFGVGLHGHITGFYRSLIEVINSLKASIMSIDIPSGLDADKGVVLGTCVRADRTVTFVAKKRGMVKSKGLKYCGVVVVKDIGFPSRY